MIKKNTLRKQFWTRSFKPHYLLIGKLELFPGCLQYPLKSIRFRDCALTPLDTPIFLSRTKLLENVFPLIRTSVQNKTISKTTDLRSQIPFPQVKVAFYKRSRICVALEHTTTLLPRGGGKGKIGTARMFSKILWKCAIFSRVLSQIVAILISC